MNDMVREEGAKVKTIRLHTPRRENFTQIDNAIMNDTRLSVNARFLYFQLYQFAWNINSNGVFPGQQLLADRMRLTTRSIRVYMDELKESGLVEVVQRGLQLSNLYIIHEEIREDYRGLIDLG